MLLAGVARVIKIVLKITSRKRKTGTLRVGGC
jgi:hypothetical protein